MSSLLRYLKSNPIQWLLIALPLALAAELGHWGELWIFALSAVGVIPLAGLIGQATEALAFYTGPKIGGLLNATLGNAAELIITLVAIKAGLLDLVKASITGSIIGNLLLVLGLSMVVGGAKNGIQKFDRHQSGNHAILMTLAVLALVIPSLFGHTIGPDSDPKVEGLSLSVSVVMIVLYVLGLIYSLKSVKTPVVFQDVEAQSIHHKPHLSRAQAILILALSTAGVVWLSELLVGALEFVVANLGLSEFFLGIILIPIIGNAAEHLVAVTMAHRNHMDLSVEIAVSSSIQIALFVTPLLVFISLLMGHPLVLHFHPFELAALGAAVLVTVLTSVDGESSWLEGAALLGVYLILGIAFFWLPA